MDIRLENLGKSFGNVVAVEDLDLQVGDGEFVAFLGPSGCGKTTTLLMLAGIYKPSTGEIYFGERLVNQIAPKDRNIGMVFQSYALYPHMTVFGNMSYPLKLKGVAKKEQQRRVQKAADTMGIGQLLKRRPGELSGGQQQRVALGRALVKEPDVLLFDEPLSNLDARLRLTMRGEIRQLQQRLGITSIYVTHDQVEAMTMADRIAVIHEGRLEAFGTPEDLYERPRTLFIAGFVGNPPMNLLDVEAQAANGDVRLANESLQLTLARERAALALQHNGPLTLGLRPEDILVADNAQDGALHGQISIVEPLGRDDMLEVVIGQERLLVLADPALRLSAGENVALTVNAEKAHFFDRRTRQSILWGQEK